MASPLRTGVCAALLLVSVAICAFSPTDVDRSIDRGAPALADAGPLQGMSLPYPAAAAPKAQPIRGRAATTHRALDTPRAIALPQASPTTPPDVPKVTLNIVLNAPDRRLQVTHHILLTNTSTDPWYEVIFHVLPARTPGLFTVSQAEVVLPSRIEHKGPQIVTLSGTMLGVSMPAPVLPGEPVSITLAYVLHIPPVAPTAGVPAGNLGAGARVIQVGDWHPTVAPYLSGSGWQRWSYHPVGDPTIYPSADYDVRLFVDPEWTIAAPGIETRHGLVRRYQLSRARCFAFLVSPDYQTIETDVGGVPLRAYYLPGHIGAAQAALDVAARAMAHFADLFGPYPTDGLVIAQNAYSGSMEYSGLISLSDQAFRVYNGSPRALLTNLTVHEVAHQWWYGAVGSDQVHEPWLDEALAKYSELLYYERYAPDLVGWWWKTHIYPYDTEGAIDRAIYDFDTTFPYVRLIYGQGARFLAELRAHMGDAGFFAFLHDYRWAGEGKLVSASDFFQILEAHAHADEDLGTLIDRYFDAAP